MQNKLFLTMLLILSSWQATGKEYGIDLEQFFSYNQANKRDYFLTLGHRNWIFVADHQETSSNNTFLPLGQQYELPQYSFDLGLGQEFFARHYLSFSLFASYGRFFGIEKGDPATTVGSSFTFKERGVGQFYGAGGNVQVNFSGYGLMISPFFGAQYLIHESKIVLDYSSKANPVATQLNTEMEMAILQYQAGIKFTNFAEGLTSFFSVNHNQLLREKSLIQGKVGNETIEITSPSTWKMEELSYTIGIGIVF